MRNKPIKWTDSLKEVNETKLSKFIYLYIIISVDW